MPRPDIALTMGDPSGVGPELCLRALKEKSVLDVCRPIVVGDTAILRAVAKATGLPFDAPTVFSWEMAPPDISFVLETESIPISGVQPGVMTATAGLAAFAYVEKAIEAALGSRVSAITTGPLHKAAMNLAGISFPGHTEIFAERTGTTRYCMLQVSDAVSCSFVTVHQGYREVPRSLTVSRVLEVIELTAEAMRRIRGREPKLLVCGLNPHAGEHGLYGNHEEQRIILPAIVRAKAKNIQVEGPVAADTAFLPRQRREYDAVVCMFHDQGHIPLKALAFDSAVNTTIGLPFVRTSVDHGTAFDIAWQGIADPGSLFAALKLAAKLSGPDTDTVDSV